MTYVRMKWRLSFVVFFCMSFVQIFAQPANDDCQSAFHISNSRNYCSQPAEFTNINADGIGSVMTSCLIDLDNDVWFTFIPSTEAVLITVQGNVDNLGTMQGPSIFVFRGPCNNPQSVGCNTVSAGSGSVEVTISDLILGEVYYIAVTSAVPGTFQLCVQEFTPVPTPEQDCASAVVLCDKSPFFVENLTGTGDDPNEVDGTCIVQELASVWYKWTCEESGTLTMTLTPNDWTPGFESDDLDFVLFELQGGINDCDPANRVPIRCMASGANTLGGIVLPLSEWEACNGPTGLREGEPDTVEFGGCEMGSNNWLAPANLIAGRSYALVVNNFSASGLGFGLEFGGTSTFVGPEVDFEIQAVQAFECDKTIEYINLSSSMTDPITDLQWNFGAGATPQSASGGGPHNVIYSSFGDKLASLTVTSSRGCQVSKIVDLYIEPCCQDTSTLSLEADITHLLCPGVNSGIIDATAISGSPLYQYSLDGVNFQPSDVFPQLGPGEYMLSVIDEKGCMDMIDVEVLDAAPFTVNAGDTLYTDLGYPVQLNAVPSPNIVSGVSWNPSGSLLFESDSLSPIAVAPGTTNYTVTVVNPAGCEAQDNVLVVVNIVRPVYVPNVFSPNGDGVNDFWYPSAGPAANQILSMRIFNRWGALVYEATGIPFGEPSVGWSGRRNGQFVEPGVFAYHLKVQFIDGYEGDYSGSVTVVR